MIISEVWRPAVPRERHRWPGARAALRGDRRGGPSRGGLQSLRLRSSRRLGKVKSLLLKTVTRSINGVYSGLSNDCNSFYNWCVNLPPRCGPRAPARPGAQARGRGLGARRGAGDGADGRGGARRDLHASARAPGVLPTQHIHLEEGESEEFSGTQKRC